jgi:hypothetical protein
VPIRDRNAALGFFKTMIDVLEKSAVQFDSGGMESHDMIRFIE